MAQVTEADTQVDKPESLQPGENAEKRETNTEAKNGETSLEDELAALNGKDALDDDGPGIDELTSLEQEIAKMHNIRPVPTSSKQGEACSVGGAAENGGTGDADEISHQASKSPLDDKGQDTSGSGQTSESPLEEVDLIALLKGTDTSHEHEKDRESEKKPSGVEKTLSELDNVDVGVTIEGEGQYEIMEIDDDDSIAASSNSPKPSATKSHSSVRSVAPSSSKPKLSAEQARAVALEQIAGLNSQKSRPRKEQPPPPPVMKAKDIVSSLNDDWDDYDSDEDVAAPSISVAKASVPAQLVAKKSPSPVKKLLPDTNKSLNPGYVANNKPLISSVKVMLKTVTQKQLDQTLKPIVVEKPTVPAAPKTVVEPTTGFKRMRVIKRKIIWDPDVPETGKSFAQYASSKTIRTSVSPKRTPTPTPTLAPAPAQKTLKVRVKATSPTLPIKKETAAKKPRASTPKDLSTTTKAAAPPKASEVARPSSPAKRRSQTPGLANGGAQKKKKVSEIDRLMGDEGAANMIHAVEHEQREMSGGEVPNKPLMRKRAMTITGRNQNAAITVEPNVTSKKETINANTTKSSGKRGSDAVFSKTPSTNSTPGSKSSASDSWDYVYKQRASEESMIMRRRSNSSYSSNASVSRLSLDNKPGGSQTLSDDAAERSDPSFKFLKPTNKNQRGVESSSHTLANDLKANNGQLVTLQKKDKVGHLTIHTQRGKSGYTYSSQLLEKLSETLNIVARSNEYNTVLLTVQGQQFCQGIDCNELVQGSLDKRRNSASQLAQALKTYLRTLATFPKPVVAGIVGNLKNLGVMQLPLVDYVVAADDCCFETHYAKLGQLPEGYALWHANEKVASDLHSRLFLLGEKLTTSDILGAKSFIDRTCKARTVNDEAMGVAQHISKTSADTYRTLKKLNHSASNAAKFPRLDEELKIIAEQWSSANCVANLKRYLSDADF
ncbi:hypothetical protein KR074_006413 [Drosophila pseudoananassae]|nr:hypothetical protein KR074_006413 [Drosophila pseudoananassae]